MESKWHLRDGQTLENTKIRDRSLALHVSLSNWKNFHRHLHRTENKRHDVEVENDRRQYLKEKSEAMTRNWENSVENIRKRNEDERLKRLEEEKNERMRRYLEIKKEREEIRRQYLDNVKRKIFMTTGYQKDLTSALITSEILFEREKQKEFKEMLRKWNLEQRKQFEEKLKQETEIAIKKDKDLMKRKSEIIQKYGKELKEDIEDRRKCEEEAKEKKIRKELEDNEKAAKEMAILKQLQEKERKLKKHQALQQKKKDLQNKRDYEQKLAQEEQEMELYANIKRDADLAMLCERRKREKEFRENLIKQREALGVLTVQKEKSKFEHEENILKNAIKEKEEITENLIKEKLAHINQLKEERLNDRKKYLERQKQEELKETHLKQWEMLNRFKTAKAIKNYNENKVKMNWENIVKYRNELFKQIQEKEQLLKAEKQLEIEMDLKNFDEEDKKFFQYANEVKERAEKGGRNIYPIEKVIQAYKKTNRIEINGEGKFITKINEKQCKCITNN